MPIFKIDLKGFKFTLVNDDFKCIIFVVHNNIDSIEPSFLNRFEKHIISFKFILPEEISKVSNKTFKLIHDIFQINLPDDDKFEISYDINKLLINCQKEEIQGILFIQYREFQKLVKQFQIEELQDFTLEKISLTLPQDIILFMKYSGYEIKYKKTADKIIKHYSKGNNNNLYKYIQTKNKTKNIIYTFSSIENPLLINISNNEIFETEMYGKMNKDNSLSTEKKLEEEIEKFYYNPNNKIFIFIFNPEETDKMEYILFS